VIVDLTEFRDDDFVLPTTSYQLNTQIIEACRRAGFEPNAAYHIASLETLKNLVRVGLGVSILPSIALVGSGRENLAVLKIRNRLIRELFLIRANDRDIIRAARVLLTYVRTSVARSMTFPPKPDRQATHANANADANAAPLADAAAEKVAPPAQ
jgi:DNA-binding transcriptional LysR family regulator